VADEGEDEVEQADKHDGDEDDMMVIELAVTVMEARAERPWRGIKARTR